MYTWLSIFTAIVHCSFTNLVSIRFIANLCSSDRWLVYKCTSASNSAIISIWRYIWKLLVHQGTPRGYITRAPVATRWHYDWIIALALLSTDHGRIAMMVVLHDTRGRTSAHKTASASQGLLLSSLVMVPSAIPSPEHDTITCRRRGRHQGLFATFQMIAIMCTATLRRLLLK